MYKVIVEDTYGNELVRYNNVRYYDLITDDDIQNVAEIKCNKQLTDEELLSVEKKLDKIEESNAYDSLGWIIKDVVGMKGGRE